MANKTHQLSVEGILSLIDVAPFNSRYTFEVELRGEVLLLSATYHDHDIKTGKLELQRTRKWFISEHATESEIVQTVLKCVLTSAEHRVREAFLYGGARVFGPHMNVTKLLELANAPNGLDVRYEVRR